MRVGRRGKQLLQINGGSVASFLQLNEQLSAKIILIGTFIRLNRINKKKRISAK